MTEAAGYMETGLSVVVPVYNSEQTLGPLIERLGPVLSGIGGPFEVILVNDGSRDGSWGVIERLAREHGYVHGIDMMRELRAAQRAVVRDSRCAVWADRDDG